MIKSIFFLKKVKFMNYIDLLSQKISGTEQKRISQFIAKNMSINT